MNATNYQSDTEFCVITKNGATTPNFGQVIQDGGVLSPLPYSVTLSKGNKGRVFQQTQKYVAPDYNWGKHTYWDMHNTQIIIERGKHGPTTDTYRHSVIPLPLSSYITNPLTTADVLLAKQRFDNGLLLKVKAQSLPILMALKERKETAELIRNFVEKSSKAVYAVRHPKKFFEIFRGRKPSARESRRLNNAYIRLLRRSKRAKLLGQHSAPVTVADAFLQYRFVYSPLLADIRSFIDGAGIAMKKGQDSYVRKGISYNKSYEEPIGSWQWLFGDALVSHDVSIVGHQKVSYMIDDASAAAYSQMQSIGATLWDSVPYSFIIDGLVSVSKYLECRNAVSGVRFVSGYKSVKQIAISKLTIKEPSWSTANATTPGKKVTLREFPSVWYQLNFTRQILTAFPEPTLEFPYASYINAQHIADISALVIQKLKGKF